MAPREPTSSEWDDARALVGRRVLKNFVDDATGSQRDFGGVVRSVDTTEDVAAAPVPPHFLFLVRYEDDDEEDVDRAELEAILVPEKGGAKRKAKAKLKLEAEEDDAGGDEDADEEEAPPKKRRGARAAKPGGKGKSKRSAVEEDDFVPTGAGSDDDDEELLDEGGDEEEDEEDVPRPRKKAPRGGGAGGSGRRAGPPVPASLGKCEHPAGSVVKIEMQSFMCHDHLVFDLGPRVNFIVGQNGSGKSAMLTALTVALGQSARATNRGVNAGSVIRWGRNEALVRVTIANTGEDAYMKDDYGDRIIVERKLVRQGTSTYTLKNAAGRVVARGAKEVEKMVDHLNIDVKNPVNVMTQDSSRNFLHSGNDRDKYQFFMKATLLGEVKDQLQYVQAQEEKMDEMIRKQEEQLPGLEAKVLEYENLLHEAQQIDRLREDRKAITYKIAWASYYEEADRAQMYDDAFQEGPAPSDLSNERADNWGKVPKALSKARLDLEQAERDLAEAKKKAVAAREQLQADTGRIGQLDAEKRAAEAALAEAKRAAIRVRRELAELENEDKHLRVKRSSLQRGIEEELKEYESLTQAREKASTQRGAKLAVAQRKVADADAELAQLQTQEEQILSQVRAAEGQEAASRQPVEAAEDRVRRLNERLSQLKGWSGRSSVSMFGGNKAVALANAIQQNKGRFSRPPIGPVGMCLSVKDDKWAVAVEQAAGRSFNQFIVHDHQDKQTLMRLAQQVGYGNCSLVVSNFDTPPHQLPPNQLPGQEFTTVLDVLQIDNHTVRNFLIDIQGVERNVLVEDYASASRVAYGGTPNVGKAFYRDGGACFSVRGAQHHEPITSVPQHMRQPRLFANRTAQVEQYKQALQEANAALASAKQQREAHAASVAAARRELEQTRKQLSRSRRSRLDAQTQMDTIESQQEEEAYTQTLNEPNVAELEKEVAELDEQLGLLPPRKAELVESSKAAAERVAAAQEKASEVQRRVAAVTSGNSHLEAQVQDANSDIEDAQARVEHKRLKKTSTNEKVKVMEGERAEAHEKREKARVGALKWCTEEQLRAVGGRYVAAEGENARDVLGTELVRIDKRIRREEQRLLDGMALEELEANLEEARRTLRRQKRKIDQNRKPYELMREGLQKRTALLKRNAKDTEAAVSEKFNYFMSRRSNVGRIKVDHKRGELNMSVTMNAVKDGAGGRTAVADKTQRVKDCRTLSGGERSYSTLSFTLALGRMTEAPFRCMDEFDVFMDANNRTTSLETLIKTAKADRDTQYIFLTPNEITALSKEVTKDGSIVKVHKLEPARQDA